MRPRIVEAGTPCVARAYSRGMSTIPERRRTARGARRRPAARGVDVASYGPPGAEGHAGRKAIESTETPRPAVASPPPSIAWWWSLLENWSPPYELRGS